MKKYILIIAIILASGAFSNAFSQTIDLDQAQLIAKRVFSEMLSREIKNIQLEENYYVKEINESPALYIFNETSGGFVIVSGDERITPILGYSHQANAELEELNWNPEFAYWMETYFEQIEHIKTQNLTAQQDIEAKWQSINNGEELGISPTKDVAPLLATTWSQGCGYNALCPVDVAGPCGRVYTGCVATAMAQAIRHIEHPVNGIGDKCYTHWNYGELCADFAAATYDYSSMTNSSGNAEVAELIYHCGVAVDMNYSPTGSGAYSSKVLTAYKSYFDLTNCVSISRGSFDNADWDRILRNEIDNNRPFYYSGSGSGGHAFVFDGYQNTDYFHVNWGWGGSYDGYFYCDDLTPGSHNYTSSQTAIIGTIPTSLFTGLDVSGSTNLTCASVISGDISTGTNYVNYYKNTYPTAVGKELVYDFTTTLPGRIRVKITNNIGGDVNVFLLSHPHQDSLISYGTNGLIIDDTEASTYYIAVEGVDGVEPSFDIEVICPTIDAELIIENATVSPGYVESNLTNVVFSSSVKNIGNTIASASVIEYFISDDMIYDDGVDTYIGQDIVPILALSESCNIETILTMPAGLTVGTNYIVFNVDRGDIIVEQDEENLFFRWVQVPAAGTLDCSSSVSLTNGIWYYGNTETDGESNVENYAAAWGYTSPEVIHSFISSYNGMAKLTFTEKQAGQMSAMVLPICNENSHTTSTWFNQPFDTITSVEFYVNAGIEYFIVVDGAMPNQGDYGLLIELPEECPFIEINVAGTTNLCDGDWFPNMWANWGYNNYQWYKDGMIIGGANSSNYSPTEAGSYFIETIENSCTSTSTPIVYSVSPRPDTAQITSAGATEFCDGESVVLSLSNTVSFPLQWIKDDVDISGATSNTYSAIESGKYQLVTTNGSCSVKSIDYIDVYVNNLPVDIGEEISIPSDTIEFYYSFNDDNKDDINNYDFWCWDFLPANDKDDNFWQARDFTAEDYYGESGHYYDMPDEYTLSLWFTTTTVEGGLIANFTDNSWGPTYQEALIYMSDDGKLHYYLSNGGTPAELTSTASYNDGNWHHVLITHDFGMLMEIDGGVEFEQISTAVSHESFSGTWVFAGQSLPVDISDTPTSAFFNGKMDEIICLNESKYLLRNFRDDTPQLDIYTTLGSDTYCNSTIAYFTLENSQNNIQYQLWNNTTSSFWPFTETGYGGDLSLGGEDIAETSEFMFLATDPATGCETWLDTTITIYVYPSLSPNITISSDAIMPMCEETTVNFTSSITNSGTTQIYEWYVNGVAQGVNDPNFSYSGLTDIDTVYSVVWGDYICQSVDSAISNEILLIFTPESTPSVSIIYTPVSFVCPGSTITFVANAIDCGTSPTYQWYREGLPIGTDSDTYAADDFVDNEEVYVIVTSDYLCSTAPTAESNHLFSDVSIPPESAMSVTGGYCSGEEACFTYTGETAGLDHLVWDILDGSSTTHETGFGPYCLTPTGSMLQIAVWAFNADGCSDSVTFYNPMLSPSITPTVSIISDQVTTNCQYQTVAYTANPVDCGSNPIYQWYNNGLPVGTNSDTYSVFNSENGDDIYVIVTNDLSCANSSTAESNHILADVYIVPQASMSITGENCDNDEICMTYTGETAGVVDIEWRVSDGTMIIFAGFGPHCFIPVTSDPHISLYVYDINGCWDSTSNYLTINTAPDIDIFDTIYKCADSYAGITIDDGFTTYLWSNGDEDNHFATMDEGLFYITVTDEFGCSDTDSIIIENYPDHSFDLVSDTTICMDEMVTLEINNAYVYNDVIWDDGISNVWHEVSPTIGYMGNNPQFIYVEATDDNCSYDDTIYIYFDFCDFIDTDNFTKLEVYPNPAKSFVTFESNQQIDEIVIYDITGKIIYAKKLSNLQFNIEIENWAEAVYYIQLTTITGEVIKTRFIKI